MGSNMKVKSLENINFTILMNCFLEAFENYFVKMPTDHEYYKKRWGMANVRLDLSYGMFDQNKLVGFIINAVDERDGKLIAFNTGTGVIPEYRGKRIVHQIYQHAIPELKQNGVVKCALEVIKDNAIAIKTYKRIGFSITKHYKCYSGEYAIKDMPSNVQVKKVDMIFFDWDTIQQTHYSWDNHIQTIKKGDFEYFVVSNNQKEIGYFVMNPENGYIPQFNILTNEDSSSWNHLFKGIQSISKTIKINNVDESLKTRIKFLDSINLKNTVDQYEMEFDI